MYRFGTAFKGRFANFQRQLLTKKVLKTTLITSVAITYAHFSLNSAECDSAHLVPSPKNLIILDPVKPVTKEEIEVLADEGKSYFQAAWEGLMQRASDAFENISTAVRYMERLITYAFFGAPLVGLVPANYLFGSKIPQLENMTWGYLTWALQQLGPCFVKMAQWASTRPDLFPPKLIEQLETLQDKVNIFHPISAIEKTLTEAFGDNWKNHLVVDYKPIGTGSVAQVFKGFIKKLNPSTHEEEKVEVAIKMIHPHVEKLINVDMELFNVLADYLDYFPTLELLSIGESFREFSKSMKQQLDLRLEANHLIHFSKNFINEKWAVFPKPITEFVTKNVMVETFVEGTPITHFMKLSDDVSKKVHDLKLKLSDLGSRLIIKMVFFDNYVHGDLHPGNILVQMLPNGEPRLVILDCGIVYAAGSKAEHDKLVDICIAFMKHDGFTAGKLMVESATAKQLSLKEQEAAAIGKDVKSLLKEKQLSPEEKKRLERNQRILTEKVEHAEEFCEGIQQMVVDAEHEQYFEHIGEYLAKICDLARKHVVRLDPGYFKIAMALKVAEGISLALDRNLQLVDKCIPIVVKAQALQKLGIQKFPEPDEREDEKFIQQLEKERRH